MPSPWGFLELPAWLLVISVAFVAGVKGAVWIRQSAKNGNGNGHVDVPAIESRVKLLNAVEAMQDTIERISAQLTTSSALLNGAASILAQMQERLGHVASTQHVTRELTTTRDAIGKEVTQGFLGVTTALTDGMAKRLGELAGEVHNIRITQELHTGLMEVAAEILPPAGGHKRRRDDR